MIVALVVLVGVGASAQEPDDLAQLLPEGVLPLDLAFENVAVDALLDSLATIGNFRVYFDWDVRDLSPVDMRFENVEFEVVLRAVLNLPGVSYTVVGDDTLLVSRS